MRRSTEVLRPSPFLPACRACVGTGAKISRRQRKTECIATTLGVDFHSIVNVCGLQGGRSVDPSRMRANDLYPCPQWWEDPKLYARAAQIVQRESYPRRRLIEPERAARPQPRTCHFSIAVGSTLGLTPRPALPHPDPHGSLTFQTTVNWSSTGRLNTIATRISLHLLDQQGFLQETSNRL